MNFRKKNIVRKLLRILILYRTAKYIQQSVPISLLSFRIVYRNGSRFLT